VDVVVVSEEVVVVVVCLGWVSGWMDRGCRC